MNSWSMVEHFSAFHKGTQIYQERRRKKVLDEPKLDATFGVAHYAEDHDRRKPLWECHHQLDNSHRMVLAS